MSVLVDTSVWVHHLRRGDPALARLLDGGEVICHPFVIGELACGTIRNRDEVLALLATLPQASMASDAEAMSLIELHGLYGRGLGWIDVHLLGSGLLSACTLWTADRSLRDAADRLGIAAAL